MKKVLIIAAVSGFLMKFEAEDVKMLQEMGYEVHYASNRLNQIYRCREEDFRKAAVHFHHVEIQQSPLSVRKNWKALKEIRRILEEEGITRIHCHTPIGGVLGRIAARSFEDREIKVIYTVHGFHFYQGCNRVRYHLFYGVERQLAKFTDAIVTINQEDYKAARDFQVRNHGKVYRIPGVGIDMDYFALPDRIQRICARRQLHVEDKFYLLSVGELRKNKNQQIIIRALAQLKKQGFDISRICYGMAGVDRENGFLEKLAEELQVDKSVVFYGYQQDVRPYLAAADAFAFPSVREGLGMAALEAMSMGVPVLAADNRGTREYMCPPMNGLVYHSDDVAGFAEGIRKMVQEQSEWQEEEKKQIIRNSVCMFERSCAGKVMRRVYEETFN